MLYVMGWIVYSLPLKKKYIEVLIPNTSVCEDRVVADVTS